MPRCGTFVLAGRPNAGKSTLLNALVGQSIAITSPKPQSTRLPVVGIRTALDAQFVFIDPPGLLDPGYPLQEAMAHAASDALRGADAVLYLHPITERPWPLPGQIPHPSLAQHQRPLKVVLTKKDLAPGAPDPEVAAPPAETDTGDPRGPLRVSAVTGEGLDDLLTWCLEHAPEQPFRYPPDEISTQPVRFFAAEFVREAALTLLGDELPYAIAVDIDEFRDTSDPLYIRATVYVERESQKGMVIGAGGRTVKQIGTRAREAIEAMVGSRVFLELRVKVLKKWRSDAAALRRLGFPVPPRSAS